ncbi:MAG: 30S ribosomal protein S3ae [Candidatus Kariarchaeaceae archaeon]|jgi:small subunit ribosomal protein S3Ae
MSSRRSPGRRRRKKATDAADKWKNKIWLKIKTPDYIDEKELGETLTSDVDIVVGRTVKISLMDLTGSFKDLNYQLIFKVSEVTGNVARTEFFGQELSRDFRRSQIRNHRSQVEGIYNLKLADESKVRVKTFVVTPVRAAASIKKEIRDMVREKLEELCSELTFAAFVNKLLSYELTHELLPVAQDVFPIKILEIAKVKVTRYPEGMEIEEPIPA